MEEPLSAAESGGLISDGGIQRRRHLAFATGELALDGSSPVAKASTPPSAHHRPANTLAGYFVLVTVFFLVAADRPGMYEVQFCDPDTNPGCCPNHLTSMFSDTSGQVRALAGVPTLWPVGLTAGVVGDRQGVCRLHVLRLPLPCRRVGRRAPRQPAAEKMGSPCACTTWRPVSDPSHA
jgi:hypothetical protein